MTMSGLAFGQQRTVSGTVRDAASQAPIAGATVTVANTAIQTTTDANGAFTLTGVAKGPLTLRVTGTGYDGVDIALAAGQATANALLAKTPPKTRMVTGRVVDAATHEPLADAEVEIAGAGISVRTDERGFFVLADAPTIALALQVRAAGHAPQSVSVPLSQSSVAVAMAPDAPPAPEPVAQPAEPVGPRTVTGRVSEAGSGEPVIGATVQVVGTKRAVLTDADGNYTITDAPIGELVLEITSATHVKTRAIVAADATNMDVETELATSEIIEMVGRAPQLVRQNLGNGASVVAGDDLREVSSSTIDDGLSAKVAGANIQRNSGAPGGGVQLKLRGISTINGQNSPLYVVDGVIVSNVSIPSGISRVTASTGGSAATATQDNQVNRIADIDPNDISNVEILKGPAAAALYGSKAANGVVIITTRSGRTNQDVRVSLTQRFGFSQVSNSLGSRKFETMQEAIDVFGDTAADYYENRVYDHEKQLFGRQALAVETLGSLSGGGPSSAYNGSILVRDEPGVLTGTGYQKQTGKVGFSQGFGDKLTVSASANVIHSENQRGMTQNDNAGVSHYMVLPSTPSFLNLERDGNGVFPRNAFIPSETNPLQTIALMSDNEEVWRAITSARANLEVFEDSRNKVGLNANLGIDWFQQQNRLSFPRELYFEDKDGLPGTQLDQNAENLNLNATAGASWKFRHDQFTSLLSGGLLLEQRDFYSLLVWAQQIPTGQENVDKATSVQPTQLRQRVKDRGGFIQEEVALLDDALSLKAGVLIERSSVNGDPDKLYLFPKAGAVYELSAPASQIDTVRFRGAYGEAGNQPNYGAKFTPLNANNTYEGLSTLTLGLTAGDIDIEPERQRELEAGVDLVAWNEKVVFEGTLYQRTISNLLLTRTLAPSQGFGTEILNGGELRNRGLELMAQVRPVDHGGFTWLSRTIFSMNRSKITDLPVPTFNTGGFGTSLGAFRIEEGQSATQIVGRNGFDDDGAPILEIVGDAEPDFRMSFVNNFEYKDWGLTSLWDWQQGSQIVNLTKLLYDGSQNTADFDKPLPASEVTDDYATVGEKRLFDFGSGLTRTYIEDATFLKLREVSVFYNLPARVISMLGPVDSGKVSLSGRNLLTFTPYTGLDPEVSNFGNQSIARNIDVAPFPPTRSFWLSLTLNL